ncbi:nucleotide exchange factor GrpE [Brackiella oedipodis]|uniref:nucleotide exchange factor GrpE n=1 Tax=Brackiella oedipodis TaxID=124225 RepID=UPI00048FED98|nr:nucleotide exchange factor GrpE [Brackiella oedipodis]
MTQDQNTSPAQEHSDLEQATTEPHNQAATQAAEAQQGAESEALSLEDLQAQIDNQAAEIAELKDQVLRKHAEAENARRRATEDVSKARKFGIQGFAESLIPVKDSLEAALKQENQTLEGLNEGVETTLKQLVAAFERNGLTEINPQAGQAFDPNFHNAVSSVPNPDYPANHVIETLQKGYSIGNRVLRAAMVVVSAG